MPSNSHQPGQNLKRAFLARLLANKMIEAQIAACFSLNRHSGQDSKPNLIYANWAKIYSQSQQPEAALFKIFVRFERASRSLQ